MKIQAGKEHVGVCCAAAGSAAVPWTAGCIHTLGWFKQYLAGIPHCQMCRRVAPTGSMQAQLAVVMTNSLGVVLWFLGLCPMSLVWLLKGRSGRALTQ